MSIAISNYEKRSQTCRYAVGRSSAFRISVEDKVNRNSGKYEIVLVRDLKVTPTRSIKPFTKSF